MGLSWLPTGASYKRGFRRTLSRHRWSAKELVYRPARRFAGGWTAVAHRTLHHRSAGSAVVGMLGVIGPALTAMFKWGDWEHPLYVLMLYAVIAVVDGFVLQPYIMKRTAKVPIWASILAPIVLGMIIPFWGVLLAPPLLAVLYAYKARQARMQSPIL